VPVAVEEDLRARGLSLEEVVHERGVPVQGPLAVPIRDHQEGVSREVQVLEQAVDPLQRRLVGGAYVVNRYQKPPTRR
jgi:hypothetical protein